MFFVVIRTGYTPLKNNSANDWKIMKTVIIVNDVWLAEPNVTKYK